MKDFQSFFQTVGGNEGSKCHYPTRLDTYGRGCQHNCLYCYAKSLLQFRYLWNASKPAVADISQIRKIIDKNLKEGDIVRLGGMTDCFQPLECEQRVTYQTIEELNRHNVGYLIVTKSDLVADDEYLSILRPELAHIQITVTSTDDAFSQRYENAVPPSRRIKAIEKLWRLGYDVSLRLSPFIPQFIRAGYLDIDRINAIECDKVVVEFLRVNAWIKRWFNIDYREYTYSEGGYQHMTIPRKHHYLKMITGFKEKTVCEDVTHHYQYWQRNVNYNTEDCCNLRK